MAAQFSHVEDYSVGAEASPTFHVGFMAKRSVPLGPDSQATSLKPQHGFADTSSKSVIC